MRTVDPAQWSKKFVKPALHVARPFQYRVNVMTTFERRMRESFCDAMMEFMRNCSMKNVRCIVNMDNPKSVRWCHLVILLSTLAFCLVVTCYDAVWMSSWPPLAVLMPATLLPVREVDFPAVALCSYNTISRVELDSYASHLYSLQRNNTYSMENLKNNLLAFSGLITSTAQMAFDSNFTKFLAEVARETNVTNVIYKLSPKCESMLVRCSWGARRTLCRHLFTTRMTDVGYCCVFNARYSLDDQHNPPYRVAREGQDSGLSVVVKENVDDFTIVRHAGEELELLLFDGSQYPLVRAGVLRSYPARHHASVFVALRATVQRAQDSLRYYCEAWRGCTLPAAGGRGRCWAQCVAECRRRAVLALCRCSPLTEPGGDARAACSLAHVACLDKHRDKMSFFYPGEAADESLSQERSDSVECLHCRPDCARLRFAARVWAVPHAPRTDKAFHNSFAANIRSSSVCRSWEDVCGVTRNNNILYNFRHFNFGFRDGLKLENTTIIRIFFASKYQSLYLVESNLRISQIISFTSSQWVFVVGLTVIAALELVYHCTFRWRHHYLRRWRRERDLPKLMEFWDEKELYGQ